MMNAHRCFVFLLVLCFLLVDVSVSIPLEIAPRPVLTITRPAPQYIRRVFASKTTPSILTKLKSLFNGSKAKFGEVYQSLKEVKEFLDLVGYLNSTLSTLTDEFTPDVQSAIIKYQKNYNLQVTGQLDPTMYNLVTQPRCGVPDIINGTTTMNSGEANTTSFTPWWKTGETNLSYAFDPRNNVADIVRSLFRDAFNRWSNVTSLNFTETTSFNASDIIIAIVTWDGKGGNVGVAYVNSSVHVGGIYLDGEEDWALPSEVVSVGQVDLESVVMHEIGHLLGLGHSSVEQAIMYPIALQEKKVSLANDDLQRIHQINYEVKNSGNNSNGSASSNGTADHSIGGVAGHGLRCNLVLAFASGFAFMILGFF